MLSYPIGKLWHMRAVMLEVDEKWLAERRTLGLDRLDEMWEGVLHAVPPPQRRHQGLAFALGKEFEAAATKACCNIYPGAGVFAAANDYRVPDLVIFPPSSESERGVDGPPLVVIEIQSPNDESYEKVPWYLSRGARCVVVIDQDRFSVEVFTPDGTVRPEADALVAVPGLGVRIGAAADAGALVVETEEGAHRIWG
jgi:Uma2 family endonuclease